MADDSPLLRRALDGVTDAVWVLDRGWRVVYCNRPAGELAGVEPSTLSGTDARELFPAADGSDGHAAIARVLAGGAGETCRLLHPRFRVWAGLRVDPDPVGARVSVQVIDRVVELETRQQLTTAILSSVGEGIYGVDTSATITFANPAAERLLGYPPGGLVGLNAHAALHHTRADGSPYPAHQCSLLRTLADGQPRDTAEDLLWRADGGPISVERRCRPIEQEGQVTGGVVSFLDLSDRLIAAQAEMAAASALGALHELQQVLQPPPPGGDDPRLGVCYLPADIAGAGGDLYDWQQLSDGWLHLSVVDVVGKGLTAARDALAVTHALRLLVLAKTPLGQIVRQASWLLADAYPDLAATAIVAQYDPRTGALRFVCAGHPPPLLITPDGASRYLQASGRPLGWPEAGTDDIAEIVVPPGGRVLFYTDGLVEAGRDIVAGMAALARLAVQCREESAAETARHLVTDVLAGAARRDDCLALVLDRPHAA